LSYAAASAVLLALLGAVSPWWHGRCERRAIVLSAVAFDSWSRLRSCG
jgi:hypothetical protein